MSKSLNERKKMGFDRVVSLCQGSGAGRGGDHEIPVRLRKWIAFLRAIGCDELKNSTPRGDHTMKTLYLPRISISLFFLALFACLGGQVRAATHVWKATADGALWSDPNNWTNGRPFSGEEGGTIVQFGPNATTTNSWICDIAITVDQIHFTGGGNTIKGDNDPSHSLSLSGDHAAVNLLNDSGTNQIGGSSLATTLKFNVTGSTLFWTLTAGTRLNISANMAGDTGINITGGSATTIIELTGDNNLSNEINVVSGTLQANSSSTDGKVSLTAGVRLGSAIGNPGSAVLKILQSGIVANTVDVIVNGSGLFDLSGQTAAISELSVSTGGQMKLGNGTLTTNGTMTVDGATLAIGGGTLNCNDPLQLLNDAKITLGTPTLTCVLNVNQSLAMAAGIIEGTPSAKAQPDVVNLNAAGDVTATSTTSSSSAINCKVTLNAAPRSFSVADGPQAVDFTINGVIADGSSGSGIIKRDFGVMAIVGTVANTFTGSTTVERGTLQLGNTGGLAIPGTLTVGNTADAANQAIVMDLADNQILYDNTKVPTISTSGQIALNGHAETFPNITGTGSIDLGPGNMNPVTGIIDQGSFTFGGDNTDTTWGGVLRGVGSFNKVGTGAFTFTGSSTAVGPTMNVKAGKMFLNSVTNSQGASAKLVIGPGTGSPATLANCVTVELQRANQIPDSGEVVVNSDGLLNVKGFADKVGLVTVNGGAVGGLVDIGSAQFEVTRGLNLVGGRVTATNAGNLVLSSDVVASASASLGAAINAPVALDSSATFTVAPGGQQPALTITGVISNGINGTRGLTKTGLGTLAMEGTNGNTYNGVTIVDQGLMTVRHTTGPSIIGPVVIGNGTDAADTAILRALIAAQYNASSAFTINASGTLDSTNQSETVGALASTGTTGGKVLMGSGTLTIDGASTTEFDGVIVGSGGLLKQGSGSQGLGGANPYFGQTIVSSGALLVNGSLLNSAVSVIGTGTLGGVGTVGSATATVATSAVRPGLLTGGSLQVTGDLDLSNGNLAIDIDDSTAQKSNRLAVAGTLNISGTALNISLNGTAGQPVYVLASYNVKNGLFATPTLPPGYMLTYTFDTHLNNQVTNNNIALVKPVVTSSATAVSGGGATLNGTATLGGVPTSAYFEYGIDNAFNLTTDPQGLGSGTYSVPMAVPVTGLTPDSNYKYRLVVTTDGGTVRGAEQSFHTPDAPIVVTGVATTITATSVKFNGTVNGSGRTARYFFQYGETTSYGLSTKISSVASASPLPVNVAQTGLFGGRTYHFRLVGTLDTSANPVDFYYGADATFTTLGPVVSTLPATGIAALSATANGTVNPQGKTTTVYFEYGLTATGAAVQTFTLKTPVQTFGGTEVSVMGLMKPLGFNKSYSFRIVASNSGGISRGNTQVFTTRTVLPPNITTQPTPKLAALGSPVTFSVVVTELVPTDSVPTYKWRKNGAVLSGATSANYTIPAVALTHAGSYDCVVTNAAGTSTTTPAVPLAVADVASKSLNLAAGTTATMTVNNAGTGLGFTWKKGASSFVGGDSLGGGKITVLGKTASITKLMAGDAGEGDSDTYTCTVTPVFDSTHPLTATFTLKVFNDKPVITADPVNMPDALVSAVYLPSGTSEPSGFKIPINPSSKLVPTSYSSSTLPAGLKLDLATGIISGKPTAASKPDPANPGSYLPYSFTLRATNSKGTASVTGKLVVKPLPVRAIGTFNGLVDRDAETAPTLTKGYGGNVVVTVTAAGTFSGNVGLGALGYKFTGVLDSSLSNAIATSNVTIKRTAPLPALVLNLSIDGTTGLLTGDITDNVIAAPVPLHGWVNPWTALNKGPVPALVATKYTAALEIANADLTGTTALSGDPVNVLYPQGNGYTTLAVATSGAVTWAGKMADGVTPTTYSTIMGEDGSIPVHLMLYTNTGSAHGTVKAVADSTVVADQTNGGLSKLDGTLDWNKTAQIATSKDLVYKAGFPKHDLTVLGGAYVAPAAKKPVLGVTDTGVVTSTNAHITFTEGGLTDIAAVAADSSHPALPFIKGSAMASNLDLDMRITNANAGAFVAGSNPAAITLSIVPSTGVMTGAFTLKDTDPTGVSVKPLSRPGTYGGVIVNRVGFKKGIGFFLLQELPVLGPPKTVLATMPKLSGQVLLEALPVPP